ncbi:hypothetical protein NL108_014361 [Boleophthalmus pectinirostris]|nr:hypothetical protein NL108_014361 [Boleophthalmus pectinirostris]
MFRRVFSGVNLLQTVTQKCVELDRVCLYLKLQERLWTYGSFHVTHFHQLLLPQTCPTIDWFSRSPPDLPDSTATTWCIQSLTEVISDPSLVTNSISADSLRLLFCLL